MSLKFKSFAALALSAAMMFSVAACGTTDSGDAKSDSKAKNTTVGYDVSTIKKGDSDTAKAVQAAMQKLMDDGTYMKILKHWGVESGAVDKAEINPTDLG